MENEPGLRKGKSDAPREVRQSHPQSGGDSEKSIQGDIFLSAFNFPDEFVTQVCLFGQLLLAQASLLAMLADVLPNGSTVQMRHSLYGNKNAHSTKPDICAIFSLPFHGRRNTRVSNAEMKTAGKYCPGQTDSGAGENDVGQTRPIAPANKVGRSLCASRCDPMSEIRRRILGKLLVRIEREGLFSALPKKSSDAPNPPER